MSTLTIMEDPYNDARAMERRPSAESAYAAIRKFPDFVLERDDYNITMCPNGDFFASAGKCGWTFWILPDDAASYVHEDLSIEWLGSSWPSEEANPDPDPKAQEPQEEASQGYLRHEEPDISPIFAYLVERWKSQEPVNGVPFTQTSLADWLGVTRQKVSNWLHNNPRPPWWAVMWLCQRFSFYVEVRPNGETILREG